MKRFTSAILAGLAMGALTTGAFAADDNAAFGFKPTVAQSDPTPPALNAPAQQGVDTPITVAEGGPMALPPGATPSPVGPGSGVTFALNVPPDVAVSLATLEVERNQPPGSSGGYGTASGPDSDSDGVPPVLGVDLTTQGAGTLGFTPVQTQSPLGQ